MLHHSKIRAISACNYLFHNSFSTKRPIYEVWQHKWGQVDKLANTSWAPENWPWSKKVIKSRFSLSQFSDGFVTLLQQRRNSAVLPTQELFLLNFLWL